MASQRLVIGIDLGGTKISTGLVSESAQVIARDYRETLATEGEDEVIGRMVDAAHTVMREASVTADQVAAVVVEHGQEHHAGSHRHVEHQRWRRPRGLGGRHRHGGVQ